jgi:hypothetical protein
MLLSNRVTSSLFLEATSIGKSLLSLGMYNTVMFSIFQVVSVNEAKNRCNCAEKSFLIA